MLDFFRHNARGTLGKVIVGAIVVVFTLWGAESIVSISGGGNSPASVNGTDISEYEVQRQTMFQQRQLQQQFGNNFDPSFFNEAFVRQNVIQSLVNQQLQLQAAQDIGIAFSDSEVTSIIVGNPAFQLDGNFDEDVYRRTIGQQGFTPQQYKEAVRQDMLTRHLRSGIVNTAFSLESEVTQLAKLENQTRDIRALTISVNDLKANVELTDEEVSSYYESNKARFRTEDQVKVDYVQLTPDALKANTNASDEEIQSAYDEYVSGSKAEVSKTLSHILVAVDDDTNKKQARELIAEIQGKISAGDDFAALAKEYSDDPGSKDSGGSLGEMQPGLFVQEFEEAALALEKAGDVSGPVETDFGIHIIKLDEIATPEIASLADKRDELAAEIVEDKVADELIQLQEQMSNAAFAAPDLTDIASDFELTVATSEFFPAAGGQGIFADQNLVKASFAEGVVDKDENSDVISLPDGSLVVVHLNEFKGADFQPLDEVRAQVEAQLKDNKAKEKAEADAEKLLADLQGGAELESVVEQGYSWQEHNGVTRKAGEVNASILQEAFKLPKPAADGYSFGQSTGFNGDVTLIAVTNVADVSDAEDTGDNLDSYLVSQTSEGEYENWFNQSRSEADINIRN